MERGESNVETVVDFIALQQIGQELDQWVR